MERQQHEIERLQEQVAERDQKIADAEKQIADSEKQIADAENRSRIWNGNWQHAKRILLTLPNHHPPMDWPGSRGSAGGEKRASANRVDRRAIPAITAPWFRQNRFSKCARCCRWSASIVGSRCRSNWSRSRPWEKRSVTK